MARGRGVLVAFGCALMAASCAQVDTVADSLTAPAPSTVTTSTAPTSTAPTSTVPTSTALTSTVPTSTVPTSTVAPTTAPPSTVTPTTAAPSATAAPSTTPTTVDPPPIPIRIRLDRRVSDEATADFAGLVRSVLTDRRGWQRAGFAFSFADAAGAYDYTVVLAEGSEVDQLCLPYDTGGRFSCQIGSVVALNADRWRTATGTWPASLDEYRTMLVNHEVGHLIGQHHPSVRCAGDGLPSPVMAQQSSGVLPCTANPWPLDWEIQCASLGLEPIAPPYERNIELTCGPDGPLP